MPYIGSCNPSIINNLVLLNELKQPWSSMVLCKHAGKSDCLIIEFGLSGKYESTLVVNCFKIQKVKSSVSTANVVWVHMFCCGENFDFQTVCNFSVPRRALDDDGSIKTPANLESLSRNFFLQLIETYL